MATKKISELLGLDIVNANLHLTVIPALDTTSNTTRKITLQQLNDSIEANIPFAAAAFTQANIGVINAATADQKALSASTYANSAFFRANNSLNITTGGTINGDLVLTGNLSITGCTATITVSTFRTSDHIIDIGHGTTGIPTQNAGIRVLRGDDSPVQIRWNESLNKWQYTNDGTEYFDFSNLDSNRLDASFIQANTATNNAANADNKAVSAGVYANASFIQANTATTLAQAAFNQANTGGGLTANSVATLSNKTFDVSISSNNQFFIQGQSITSYSGSGQVVILQNSPTISVLNLSDSELNFDGGSGSLYWSGQSGVAQAGDLKAGVYSSNSLSNNSLFTFGGAGANNMSVSVEGSLFVGTAKPSNDGGLNTTFPGWLVVQSGGKFGGDIDTLGGLTLYGNIYSTSACSSINFVANSSGDGFGASTMQLVPDGNLTGTDQYLIIDPTAPGHIHIRAGGTQDDSGAELFLGGENSHVKIGAGLNPPVTIKSNTYSWTFDVNGELTVPGKMYFDNGIESALTLDQFGIRANTQLTLSAENYVTGNNSTILFDKNGSGITFRLEDNTPVSKNWTFNQNNLVFPNSSTQTGAAISIVELKALVANCATYGDFQTAIANL